MKPVEIPAPFCNKCEQVIQITGMSTPRGYEKMLPSEKVEAIKAMMKFALYIHKQTCGKI